MPKNKSSKFLTFLFPTFADIIWITTFIVVLLSGNIIMNQDGDLGLHLTLGDYILEHKSIPVNDLFSNSMTGQPVTQHEWLSAVIFALSYRTLGFTGVILVSAILIATTIWLVFKRMRSQSILIIISVPIIILTIIITRLHWLTRPHLFTLLIFTAWLTILRRMQEGNSKLWWTLPFLMFLWANLHGGFLIGFISWFIFAIGIIWDSMINKNLIGNNSSTHFWFFYILGGVTSLLVTIINPSGFGLWKTVVSFLGNEYLTDMISEYLSPNFHDPRFWPALIFIGLLIFGFVSSKNKTKSGELFHAIIWLIFGLYSARNLPLFAIATSPILALSLDSWLINTSQNHKFFGKISKRDSLLLKLDKNFKGNIWPVIILIVMIGGFSMNIWQNIGMEKFKFNPEIFPVEAVNWLEENPQEGKMLNKYSWGGYLLFRLWPDEQVFIDSKTDFYGEDFIREYVALMSLDENWQKIIEKYDLRWAILPTHAESAIELESKLGWIPIYKDATAVILSEN